VTTKPRVKARRRRHWYRHYVGECAVCGRDASYRERVYGRRPARVRDRYVHLPDVQTYCGCLDR
jgi:thymidine kinase